jgi:hypothetical protein
MQFNRALANGISGVAQPAARRRSLECQTLADEMSNSVDEG